MLNRRSLLAAMAAMLAEPTSAAGTVTIFAAASLKTSLDALLAPLQDATGLKARCVYAGSSALARQIEQGAPADLFWSADREWMDWCIERRLVRRETVVDLLSNRLVVIAPANAPFTQLDLTLPNFDRGLGTGRLALGETRAVPAGRYAKEALQSLGLWAPLSPRLAETDNVRAALLLVAREEAPLGIVYASDAMSEARVKIVADLSTSLHTPIVYPLAVTAHARQDLAATALAFFQTTTAGSIFVRDGFSLINPLQPA